MILNAWKGNWLGFDLIHATSRIDTSLGGFVYSDQFLQFATKLPKNSELYGFGEHEHHSLRHDMNWQTMGMYARDQPPTVMVSLQPHNTCIVSDMDGKV